MSQRRSQRAQEIGEGALTSVIIACWNALALSKVCLLQLLRRTTRPYELIVVDNGSIDGTGSWLRGLPARTLDAHGTLRGFRVVSNARNLGYPVAMNQGIDAARGDLLLFGNNDAAVAPLWLEGMQEALLSNKRRVGGVSACCNPPRPAYNRNAWSRSPVYRDIAGFERYASALQLDERRPSYFRCDDFFAGFWFLTRRSVIREVGGFDARYSPGGYDDLDLQWRIRRAGYELGFAGRTYVHHVGMGSTRANGQSAYGPDHSALLRRKFPQTAGVPFSAFKEPAAAGRRQ